MTNEIVKSTKTTYKYKLKEKLEAMTVAEYQIVKGKFEAALITKATISRIKNVAKCESYSPTDDTLQAICNILNTTTFDIKN